MQRILFAFIWTTVFMFGSFMCMLLGWRLYFALAGAPAHQPDKQTLFWLGCSCFVIPLILGLLAIVLGIRGVLPGTGRAKP